MPTSVSLSVTLMALHVSTELCCAGCVRPAPQRHGGAQTGSEAWGPEWWPHLETAPGDPIRRREKRKQVPVDLSGQDPGTGLGEAGNLGLWCLHDLPCGCPRATFSPSRPACTMRSSPCCHQLLRSHYCGASIFPQCPHNSQSLNLKM